MKYKIVKEIKLHGHEPETMLFHEYRTFREAVSALDKLGKCMVAESGIQYCRFRIEKAE